MNDTLPQSMLTAAQASDAELIQRSMAGAQISPEAIGPHADAVRHRADAADAELERRAYRAELEDELARLRAKHEAFPTDYKAERIARLTSRLEGMP